MCRPQEGQKWCPNNCEEGYIWVEIPDVSPPFLFSEEKVECEECGGEGVVDMEDDDEIS